MSAIAGIFHLDDRPAGQDRLTLMATSVKHRGPDDGGIWCETSIGLANRSLWTTPESLTEKQPLVDRETGLVVTADARIDNRDELLEALRSDAWKSELPDSQLILLAYRKWGAGCAARLIGDFAFAVWDSRKHELFCARDPMGIRPFYYYRSSQLFAFASEVKALLCLPEIPRRLNESQIGDYLEGIYDDEEGTFYRDIFRLPKAHSLTISRSGLGIRRYWSFDLAREVKLKSNEEYAEAFRDQFTEAVRCRLRSAYPVGSMLSGGLDSSSIACTARQLLAKKNGSPIHTFSTIFPGLTEEELSKIDERKYIDAVLAGGGFEPHFIHADQLGPLAELDQILWQEDEAVFAPNLYLHWASYRAAQEAGVRVLLDGTDGDSTVSYGFDLLAELARLGKWGSLLIECRALADKSPNAWCSTRQVMWEYGFKPLVPESAVQVWRRLRRHQISPGINGAINASFAQRIGLPDRVASLNLKERRRANNAKERHAGDLNCGLWGYAMEIVNKAHASFSLDARYPFFDRRLMEFCVALPLTQKLDRGWNRMILRRALAGTLPEEVRWRSTKSNLGVNFKRGMQRHERRRVDDVIVKNPKLIEEYIDLGNLNSRYERYLGQHALNESDALTIYSSVMLANWLRKSQPMLHGMGGASLIAQSVACEC
jgi:asparagine synthase (glutamine-hydrolysing)